MLLRQIILCYSVLCLIPAMAFSAAAPTHTSLSDAVSSGSIDELGTLLTHDATAINAQDTKGRTLLHHAAAGSFSYFDEKNAADCISVLLRHGADHSIQDKTGRTPLHIAAGSQHTKLEHVTALLDAGADVNALTNYDYSPLLYAAQKGKKDIVELLLSRGADAHQQSLWAEDALHLATIGSKSHPDQEDTYVEAISIIKSHMRQTQPHAQSPASICSRCSDILIATQRGHAACTQHFIDQGGININKRYPTPPWNSEHFTLLLWAAHNGHADVITVLVDAGANIECTDPGSHDRTPLLWAVIRGNTEAVKALVQKGANVEAHTPNCHENETPLYLAAATGNVEISRILLDAGANPHSPKGYNPMTVARQALQEDPRYAAVVVLLEPYFPQQDVLQKKQKRTATPAQKSSRVRTAPKPNPQPPVHTTSSGGFAQTKPHSSSSAAPASSPLTSKTSSTAQTQNNQAQRNAAPTTSTSSASKNAPTKAQQKTDWMTPVAGITGITGSCIIGIILKKEYKKARLEVISDNAEKNITLTDYELRQAIVTRVIHNITKSWKQQKELWAGTVLAFGGFGTLIRLLIKG